MASTFNELPNSVLYTYTYLFLFHVRQMSIQTNTDKICVTFDLKIHTGHLLIMTD